LPTPTKPMVSMDALPQIFFPPLLYHGITYVTSID
jgi:hypothetical protein